MNAAEAFELARLDACAQAALVRSGDLAPHEPVEAAILRIEALDPSLNAVSACAFEVALASARRLDPRLGPLAGAPWLAKEGLDYPGLPTRFASRLFADAPPATDAFPFARRLDAAGLVAVGKSAAPEFALLPSTEPVLYGPTRNPWDLGHSVGGSSGGAAAAVAAGLTPVAHASDGGGSIRIPAACCGVFGLKPSRFRNVRARGHHVVEDLLVGDSLLSRSVRDAHMAAWITAAAPQPPARRRALEPLRIAVSLAGLDGEAPDPEVAAAVLAAARLCADLGHAVETVTPPIDGPAAAQAFKVLWGYLAQEAAGLAGPRLAGRAVDDVLEPWTLGLAAWGRTLDASQLERALAATAAASAGMAAFHKTWDVVLSPVTRTPPPSLGWLAPDTPFDTLMARMFDYVAYTPLQNLTGAPAFSAPLGRTATGLPIGVMAAAARDDDERLIQLAYQLEEAGPWADRWPPLSAANSPRAA